MPALPEPQLHRRKLPGGMSTPATQPLIWLLYFLGSVFDGQLSAPLWAAQLFTLLEGLGELGLCFTALPCPLIALKAQPAFETERSDKKGQ